MLLKSQRNRRFYLSISIQRLLAALFIVALIYLFAVRDLLQLSLLTLLFISMLFQGFLPNFRNYTLSAKGMTVNSIWGTRFVKWVDIAKVHLRPDPFYQHKPIIMLELYDNETIRVNSYHIKDAKSFGKALLERVTDFGIKIEPKNLAREFDLSI